MGLVRTTSSTLSSTDSVGTSKARDETSGSMNWSLQYPRNLDNPIEYGGHKVVFFINVPGNSSLAKIQSNFNGGNSNRIGLERYMASTEITPRAGSVNSSTLPAAANEAWRTLMDSEIQLIANPRRLDACITLYVPNSLMTSYSVNWGEEDFMAEDTKAGMAASYVTAGKNFMQGNFSQSHDNVADATRIGASGVAAQVLGGMSYVQRALKMTPSQSKQEQLFKGVNFREFTFDYDFAPKSEKEAEDVLNIIRMFRHHMLPEFYDTAEFMYIYPSEFDIKFYKG